MGGGEGEVLQCSIAMHWRTFCSNVDLEHPLPIVGQNAGPRKCQTASVSVCVCLAARPRSCSSQS